MTLDAEFEWATEVLFSDVDMNGHVHHLAYLRYAEGARVQHLTQSGISPGRLLDAGLAIVILSLAIDFSRELDFDDTVVCTSRYLFGEGTSFEWRGDVLEADKGQAAGVTAVLGVLRTNDRRLVSVARDVLESLIVR
jgi:YbgC/YbaW family acyl-CoA thioester hydrolase